jgi:hypothetical protein
MDYRHHLAPRQANLPVASCCFLPIKQDITLGNICNEGNAKARHSRLGPGGGLSPRVDPWMDRLGIESGWEKSKATGSSRLNMTVYPAEKDPPEVSTRGTYHGVGQALIFDLCFIFPRFLFLFLFLADTRGVIVASGCRGAIVYYFVHMKLLYYSIHYSIRSRQTSIIVRSHHSTDRLLLYHRQLHLGQMSVSLCLSLFYYPVHLSV